MNNRHLTLEIIKKNLDPSLMQPLEYKILLKSLKLPKKTKSGLLIPQETLDIQDANNILSEVVKIGELAFTDTAQKTWKVKPVVGDIVITSKYPGDLVKETETEMYFACNDKEITMIYKIDLLKKTE